MTKFILHGGQTRIANIYNKNFYREMFKAAKGKPILVCYYSRLLKELDYLLSSEKENMTNAVGSKKVEFVVASRDLKEFLKQLKEVECVYFRGGDTLKLMRKLLPIKNKLKKSFENKTVLGSSAGAIFLAKYYYDQDQNGVVKGFGIIPAKIMTHFLSEGEYAESSGKDKFEFLKNYKEKLPVYAIKETEFKIIKYNFHNV